MNQNTREVEDIVDELYSLAWQDGSEGLNRRSALNERFQSAIHHQLQKARAEWLRTEIEKFVLPAPPDVLIPGESPIEHALREGKYHALISIITRYKEELKVLESK